MAAPRLVVELLIGKEDVTQLMAIAQSRTEPANPVERAHILLAYRDGPPFFGVGRLLGGHCHTEQVEAVFDRGEARLRHWNRVAGLSPGRQ